MYIKIWDDKYIIKSDKRQYTLYEIKTKATTDNDEKIEDINEANDGTYEVPVGYFSNLTNLFKELAEREGRLNKCTTLDGYVRHIEKNRKKLEELFAQMQATIGQKESMSRIINCMPDKLPKEVSDIGEKPNTKTKKKKKK